jgi:hypothetical protein
LADPEAIVQIKVWLLGISPMVWRRVLVANTCTLRELHGIIQVAMGWEGIHLYQLCLRAARYGSWELSTASPEVTLAALQLRKGTRFAYEYDMNIPWRHKVRIENWMEPEYGKAHPVCIGGNGACPPEDCGGPDAYLAGLSDMISMAALEDLDTMPEIIGQVVLERRAELLDDEETRWRLEQAVERSRARERAQGRPFSRRTVNARLRKGEHLDLMHQQYCSARPGGVRADRRRSGRHRPRVAAECW